MTNVQQGRNVADRKYGHKVRCERGANVATFSQKSTNRNSDFHYSEIKNLESILQET